MRRQSENQYKWDTPCDRKYISYDYHECGDPTYTYPSNVTTSASHYHDPREAMYQEAGPLRRDNLNIYTIYRTPTPIPVFKYL